jgi:hypothetical protein
MKIGDVITPLGQGWEGDTEVVLETSRPNGKKAQMMLLRTQLRKAVTEYYKTKMLHLDSKLISARKTGSFSNEAIWNLVRTLDQSAGIASASSQRGAGRLSRSCASAQCRFV